MTTGYFSVLLSRRCCHIFTQRASRRSHQAVLASEDAALHVSSRWWRVWSRLCSSPRGRHVKSWRVPDPGCQWLGLRAERGLWSCNVRWMERIRISLVVDYRLESCREDAEKS